MDSTKGILFDTQTTINCGGKLLDLAGPKVMGIVNLSPDSFYKGDKFSQPKTVLDRVNTMLTEGAAIMDVGGMSTRPGSEPVSVDEELTRVLPTVKSIIREFPDAILSVDTTKSEVARQTVAEGALMVNDISGGSYDEKMSSTVAELHVPYILMHMQGTPKDMQVNPHYDDVMVELVDFFSSRVHTLRSIGVHDIILDPGFGFGKTIEHNYRILANLSSLQMFGMPIAVGISRKSMISKPLGITSEEALNGTTALHVLALLNGTSLLRAHDVKEAMQAVRLVQLYRDQLIAKPELQHA